MKIDTHAANATQLTETIAIVDTMRPDDQTLPQWAVDVRKAMPDWGFEIHCMRWLTGLDALLQSIRESTFYPSPCGRYGDQPGFLLMAAEERASAVAEWLAGEPPRMATLDTTLGVRTPEKEEAAQCFVEIVRAFVEDVNVEERVTVLGKAWRARAEQNAILQDLFQGEGLDRGLFGGPSYWLPHRLDLAMRIIGGDRSEVEDLAGSCNWELRNVLRDDPQRMAVTLAYLWGTAAYLDGHDACWLRTQQPCLAGAAIHTLNQFAAAEAADSVVRWLATAFFVTTRFWYQRALIFAAQKATVSNQFMDVPVPLFGEEQNQWLP